MLERSRKHFRQVVAAVCALLLAQSPLLLFAQAPEAVEPQQQVETGQPIPVMAPNQLDSLVAPIALYPDPLISQILVASTYPLEVVEAEQWLQRNAGLTGPALTQAAQAQNWDPSVQALVMFPDVMKKMTDDVNWTTSLGNAFLAQQSDVMAAVQRLRLSAQQSGKLVSTPQQQVVTSVESGQPQVVIEPANPEVIYVPTYDPAWVWGPAYYPYPGWYYPHRSGFYFGAGISVGAFLGVGWGGWGGWGWHPGWGSRNIIVNNTFIRRYNFNSTRVGGFSGTSAWSHDAFHRQGVRYPTAGLNARFGNSRSFAPQTSRQAVSNSRSFVPQTRQAAPMAQARSFAPSRQSAPFAQSRVMPGQNRAMTAQRPMQMQQMQRSAQPMAGRSVAPRFSNPGASTYGGYSNRGTASGNFSRGYASSGQARAAAPMARSVAPSRSMPQRSAPASRGSSGRSSGRARN